MSARFVENSPAPFPLHAADQCVKCGMCLPHCPTYGVTRDEAESPRGRIMLMQGLATRTLTAGPALEAHLDGCLTCRACEVVCPAQVPSGTLIDSVREQLAHARPARARLASVMAAVLTNRPLLWLVALPLWLYQRLGLQWLVRRLRLLGRGRLARLESLMPEVSLPRLPAATAASAAASGPEVALFAGCTSPLTEPGALRAAVTLLEAAGCRVSVPPAQACCGALHQHAGLRQPAQACAARNLAAFAGSAPVVGIASGCTAQLLDYGLLAGAEGGAFARRAHDIHAFLLAHAGFAALGFEPLPARVLLHTPCTLRNVIKAPDAVHALLRRIPGLEIERLDSACCGAAGSYFLTQPDMADALLEPKLARARASRPDVLASSNAGCAMHLAAGLRRDGLSVRVAHPLELLAAQLRVSPAAPRA
ncbi:MAG: (Fe-S)-binding protein [Gammaproteobacteria bacterium]